MMRGPLTTRHYSMIWPLRVRRAVSLAWPPTRRENVVNSELMADERSHD